MGKGVLFNGNILYDDSIGVYVFINVIIYINSNISIMYKVC